MDTGTRPSVADYSVYAIRGIYTECACLPYQYDADQSCFSTRHAFRNKDSWHFSSLRNSYLVHTCYSHKRRFILWTFTDFSAKGKKPTGSIIFQNLPDPSLLVFQQPLLLTLSKLTRFHKYILT